MGRCKIQIMKFIQLITFIILCFSSNIFIAQNKIPPTKIINDIRDTVFFQQIVTDTLFDSNQIISILSMNKKSKKYRIEFDYTTKKLIKTSRFAKNNNALAAINGGFFDEKGSVTYFEMNDTVINRNVSKKNKWGKPKNLINGVIVLNKDKTISIDYAKQEQFYESSKDEKTVLVVGPMLISNSKSAKLPNLKFVKKRHPRTCLCTTDSSIVFLTIDGRSESAQGMNLHEAQDFLLKLNCVDAINLDGGGSTTMYIKNKGIVNHPSDTKGERHVANGLLILKNN